MTVKQYVITIICIYLAVMNFAGFLSMGIDKSRAKRQKYRIPEATLLVIAGCGGSLGSFLGMNVFRHKTKHLKFTIPVPLFLIAHIFILAFLIWRFVL